MYLNYTIRLLNNEIAVCQKVTVCVRQRVLEREGGETVNRTAARWEELNMASWYHLLTLIYVYTWIHIYVYIYMYAYIYMYVYVY